jgi:hypothetical protein
VIYQPETEVSSVFEESELFYNIVRVSHLMWNQPQQHATAAARELPRNEVVTMQNVAVAC